MRSVRFHLFDQEGTSHISMADGRAALSSSRLHEDHDGESPLFSSKSACVTRATQRLLLIMPPEVAGKDQTVHDIG
jgi:hypothetical protein